MIPMAHVRNIVTLASRDVLRLLKRRVCLIALLVGVGSWLGLIRTAVAQESPRTSPAPSPKRAKDQGPRRRDAESAPVGTAAAVGAFEKSAPPGEKTKAAGDEKGATRARRVGPREDEWVRMDEVEKEEFEQFVEKSFLEVWAELRAYKADRPRVYKQWMIDLAPQLVPLMEEASRKPVRAVLSIKVVRVDFLIRRLVSEYLLEKDKDKHAKLEQRITEAVTARFDARQERRWLDMTNLEERLRRQKELHKEKNRNRERLIRREVNAILNPAGSSNGPSEPGKPNEDDGPRKPG